MYLIVELPSSMPFDPFRAEKKDLFTLFEATNLVHRDYWSQQYMDIHIASLQKDLTRYIKMEIGIESEERMGCTDKDFGERLQGADFHIGGFQYTMFAHPKIHPSSSLSSDKSSLEDDAGLPKPSDSLLKEAQIAVKKLGEDCPKSFLDPITHRPFDDPIEMNERVYNRSTLVDLQKRGYTQDPMTGKALNFDKAKPAHYMLDAMLQHQTALEGQRPALLKEHEHSKIENLRDLFTEWQSLLGSEEEQEETRPSI